LIDLGKWVSEEYRVPGKPVPTADDDDAVNEGGNAS
jgi:endogenous inhibitor of DNA gyrase (YacG/DUF329 family)